MTSENKPQKRDRTTVGIWRDDHNRWVEILDAIAPHARQEEKTAALLKWIEQRLSAPQVAAVEPAASPQQEPSQFELAIAWSLSNLSNSDRLNLRGIRLS